MFIQDCENNIGVLFYSILQPDSQIVTNQITFSWVYIICKWYSLSHTVGRYVLRWHCLIMSLMSVKQLHHTLKQQLPNYLLCCWKTKKTWPDILLF